MEFVGWMNGSDAMDGFEFIAGAARGVGTKAVGKLRRVNRSVLPIWSTNTLSSKDSILERTPLTRTQRSVMSKLTVHRLSRLTGSLSSLPARPNNCYPPVNFQSGLAVSRDMEIASNRHGWSRGYDLDHSIHRTTF